MRPRVLVLAPWAPYPFDGGSKRIHTFCRLLKERFQFSLLSFAFQPATPGPRAVAEALQHEKLHLAPVFEEVHWVEHEESGRRPSRGLPPDVARFQRPAMRERLGQLLAHADILHVEYDLMAPYARDCAAIPTLLTQHDTGSASLFRSYLREMSGLSKLWRWPEWINRLAFQRRLTSWFDRVVTTTEDDARRLARWGKAGRVQAMPHGVDLEYFTPAPDPETESLVYVGHYPHYPNEEAVVRFCRQILPRIKRQRPRVTLTIVGSEPTSEVKALGNLPGVTVTGTVEDVRPYLQRAAVFVAPVRLGHGLKGKILEAFACARPVVAHSHAAAGLAALPGRDLLIADQPAGFAREVLSLLDSSSRRREIGQAGRRLAERRFDWNVLAGRLGNLYDEVLAAR